VRGRPSLNIRVAVSARPPKTERAPSLPSKRALINESHSGSGSLALHLPRPFGQGRSELRGGEARGRSASGRQRDGRLSRISPGVLRAGRHRQNMGERPECEASRNSSASRSRSRAAAFKLRRNGRSRPGRSVLIPIRASRKPLDARLTPDPAR
jgi:hypothetical protein